MCVCNTTVNGEELRLLPMHQYMTPVTWIQVDLAWNLPNGSPQSTPDPYVPQFVKHSIPPNSAKDLSCISEEQPSRKNLPRALLYKCDRLNTYSCAEASLADMQQ